MGQKFAVCDLWLELCRKIVDYLQEGDVCLHLASGASSGVQVATVFGSFPKQGDPQYRPQNIIIRTPKTVPPMLGNPHLELRALKQKLGGCPQVAARSGQAPLTGPRSVGTSFTGLRRWDKGR